MKGYKGFDKDWKCRDKQYEVGKTYEEAEARLCNKGLHFFWEPCLAEWFQPCSCVFSS